MSEFDLIRRAIAGAPTGRADVVIGPGDDAAVLSVPAGHELVLTTDTLVAGRHFPHDTEAADIGWKAAAVNLSDLAAMGAAPGWLTVALTLPERDEAWMAEFVGGMSELLRDCGAVLVGGDLTRGPLTVTLQAAGTVPAGTALRRDGARPGDVVAVTGTLGDAALGLARWSQPLAGLDLELRRRLTRPTPRLAVGQALRGHAHAAVDISDGLLADLGHVVDASGVGALIGAANLPQSAAFEALCPASQRLACQLGGGDDYELCVCGPEAQLAAITGLTVIGHVVPEAGVRVIDDNGEYLHGSHAGYDHFA